MKNIIAITSLLAAGTVFASAESVNVDARYDNTQEKGFDKYSIPGFKFSLGSSSTVTSGLWTLESLGIAGDAAANNVSPLSTSDTLVLYSWESANSLSFVGSSAVTSTSGSYVIKGKDWETNNSLQYTVGTGKRAGHYAELTGFSNVVLDSTKTYLAVFTTTESYTTNATTFADATALSMISSLISNRRLASGNGAGDLDGNIKGIAINSSGAEQVADYSPFIVAKLSTASIPEPSAFGLLAGVGALAFVAARRRRRAK